MANYHQRYAQCALFALFVSSLVQHSLAHAASPYDLVSTGQSKVGRLGFQSKWQSQWLQGKDSYLGGYWDAALSRDFAPVPQNLPGYSPMTQDLGLAAVLRYQRNDGSGFYAEAGTGPQYQSISYNLAGRPQGSRFALNTLAGVGFVWKNGVDLGFKAMHVTRGQGRDGNEAASMVGIGLQYRW